jgi:hypothetical protein
MRTYSDVSSSARWLGRLLVFCGGIGLVAGVVPLLVNVLRLLGSDLGRSPEDWAAHGVEALGLSVPWGTLSSADGTFLGSLLIAAGIGWQRGRAWAPLVTLLYALHGMLITGLDILIFATRAVPGSMRSWMLVLDGIACAFAVGTFTGLVIWFRRRKRRGTPERSGGPPGEGSPDGGKCR